MSDEKVCSRCMQSKNQTEFSEGRKQCDKCIEYKKQYRDKNREEINMKAKEFYEKNKEKQLERVKEYKNKNRDAILEKKKKYREEHKEEINKKNKEYYGKNKEKIQEKQEEYKNIKIECPKCKCLVGKYRMKIHEQSIGHQMRLKAYTREEAEETRRNLDYLEL